MLLPAGRRAAASLLRQFRARLHRLSPDRMISERSTNNVNDTTLHDGDYNAINWLAQ